jgi:hypothetical protein
MTDRIERECGGCTQCCKVIAVPELSKPQGQWCSHCLIGKGCAIYPLRPQGCIDFRCLWLQGYGTDDMRPDKSKVVMASTTDGKNLVLHVDPSRPEAHRVPAFDALIERFIKGGRHVIVVTGDKRRLIKEAALWPAN